MKQLILVLVLCISILLIIALILAFWDLPVDQSMQITTFPNEKFIN